MSTATLNERMFVDGRKLMECVIVYELLDSLQLLISASVRMEHTLQEVVPHESGKNNLFCGCQIFLV